MRGMSRASGLALSKALLPVLAAGALCACTTAPPTQPAPASRPAPVAPTAPAPPAPAATDGAALPHYRCEQGIEFTVRYSDGGALVDAGPRGREQLLRDAGGVTPQQTVYSNQRLRAELGLGPAGNEAILHYAAPPLQVRCVRQ